MDGYPNSELEFEGSEGIWMLGGIEFLGDFGEFGIWKLGRWPIVELQSPRVMSRLLPYGCADADGGSVMGVPGSEFGIGRPKPVRGLRSYVMG